MPTLAFVSILFLLHNSGDSQLNLVLFLVRLHGVNFYSPGFVFFMVEHSFFGLEFQYECKGDREVNDLIQKWSYVFSLLMRV